MFHRYGESLHISVTQILAVVVSYLDTNKGYVVDALLDTVAVENGSDHNHYNAIKLKDLSLK